MKDYDLHLNKLVENSIISKGQANDIIFGLKAISCKLDTLIALKTVELGRQQPQQPQQSQTKA